MATLLEIQRSRVREVFQLRTGEKGSSLVQSLLILPVFLMIVVGGYQVWRAVSIRESLRSGT
jgi:hypothetical protein